MEQRWRGRRGGKRVWKAKEGAGEGGEWMGRGGGRVAGWKVERVEGGGWRGGGRGGGGGKGVQGGKMVVVVEMEGGGWRVEGGRWRVEGRLWGEACAGHLTRIHCGIAE